MITITINNEDHGFSGTYEFTTDAKAYSFLRKMAKQLQGGNKVNIQTTMTKTEVQNLMRTAMNKVAKDLGKTVKTMSETELRLALEEIRSQYSGPRFWTDTAEAFTFFFNQTFSTELDRLVNLQILMKDQPETIVEAQIFFAAKRITKRELDSYMEIFRGDAQKQAETNVQVGTPSLVPQADETTANPTQSIAKASAATSGVPKFSTVQEILDYVADGRVLVKKGAGLKVVEITRDEKLKDAEVAVMKLEDGKVGRVNATAVGRYYEVAA